jgi:MATE family multidrug resistance protein
MTASSIISGRGALYRAHLSELVRLALPTMIQRGGVLTMSVVDTMMVGNFSADELAYQAIGHVPYAFIMLFMLGGIMGQLVVTSNAYGAGEHAACGAAWRRGVPHAAGLGIIGLIFCLLGGPVLALTGQTADLAREGGKVSMVLGVAMPFLLITVAGGYFLEGIKRPLPGMVLMIAANLLNILVNWLLVFGAGPIPALGAVGSAIATASVWSFQALLISLYIWHLKDGAEFGIRRRVADTWRGFWQSGARQRVLGYAAGASMGTENAAFSIMQLMAGVMGTLALGAYAISFNVFAVAFMASVGISTATAVRVGFYYGQRDKAQMEVAGWVGLGFNMVVMTLLGGLLMVIGEPIAAIYGDNADLILMAGGLIAFIGIVLPFDTAQTVIAGGLRGMGETWVPTGFHVISYFLIMLPLAWLFGLEWERGVVGLLEAFLIASLFSATVIGLRFRFLARRGGAGALAQ